MKLLLSDCQYMLLYSKVGVRSTLRQVQGDSQSLLWTLFSSCHTLDGLLLVHQGV